MLELYWGSLIFGVIFAVVSMLFGDMLDSALSAATDFSFDLAEWLSPMVIVGGVTCFGGTGLLLTTYTSLAPYEVTGASTATAVIMSGLVYFMYVKPMRDCENSIGFFHSDLIGKKGEVIVPVPAHGFGEVLIRVGAGNTNQTAASLARQEIAAGTQIVVAQISDGVLYVCCDHNKMEGELYD